MYKLSEPPSAPLSFASWLGVSARVSGFGVAIALPAMLSDFVFFLRAPLESAAPLAVGGFAITSAGILAVSLASVRTERGLGRSWKVLRN